MGIWMFQMCSQTLTISDDFYPGIYLVIYYTYNTKISWILLLTTQFFLKPGEPYVIFKHKPSVYLATFIGNLDVRKFR